MITFKLSFILEALLDFYFFLWPQMKIFKYESQKSENLPVLFVFTFLFRIYPGWDLV